VERKGKLEKFLSHFADVRDGEGLGVVLLTTNLFVLLFAYYLLKTVREALILTEGGAYIKAYSSAGQAALLMLVVPLYGFVATKIDRLRLITGLLAFFTLNLAIFYGFGAAGAREGVVFYIWVGIFNVFVISQFWAFATDIYTERQGERLFPMIGVGSSLGAWLGAQSAERLVHLLHATPYQLQLLAAGLLIFSAGLLVAANRAAVRGKAIPSAVETAKSPLGPGDGFSLVFKKRYLLLIAVLTVLLNVVNSGGEFLLGKLVAEQAHLLHGGDPAAQKEFIGGFYGSFFAGVNLLGFLVQTFVVSRLFRFAGVRGALFVLPAIALMSYSVLAFVPMLGLVRVLKTLENATDYSIQNTVRQALFLPTSREEKYKAKAAIDTFFMRLGDVVEAGIVRLGAEFHMATSGFAWLNVGFTLVWLGVVARLAREHRKLATSPGT
jgi:AAA family ATP:ADP antiporter